MHGTGGKAIFITTKQVQEETHKDSSTSLPEEQSPAHLVLFSNLLQQKQKHFSLSSSSSHSNGQNIKHDAFPLLVLLVHGQPRWVLRLQLRAAPSGLRASLAAARHGCSGVAGNQPPPSLQSTGIIVHFPRSAPYPMGSYREEGWQLTFQLLCIGKQRHNSRPWSLEDIHTSLGLQLSHVVHPLGLGLRHTAPQCSNILHAGNSAAQIPCLAHSKILTEQALLCLREDKAAIRKLLAGKNLSLPYWL